MASNNQEIELKLPLSKKKCQDIKRKLQKIAKFVKLSQHKDQYFTPIYSSFFEPKYPYEWLSLRQRDDKSILNYKHWYPEGAKHTTHCDEYQTEISDAQQIVRILNAL